MIEGTGSGSDLEPRATRRRLMGALAVAGTGLALRTVSTSAQEDGATPEAQAEPTDEILGEAAAPNWSLLLMRFVDPYPAEQITAPAEPPAGIRFVAVEIAIDNSANQPLNFTPGDMRVVDVNGTEYRGGQSAGAATDPFLSPRNLDGGDRSRGWVWFMVPEGAELDRLAYEAPRPLFRIALDEIGS